MKQAEMFIGTTIGGYRVKRLIGQGSLGQAYQAQHPMYGNEALISTFPLPEEISIQEHKQLGMLVAQKAEALTRLVHPNILPVYACGIQDESFYLISALVEDVSLSQTLQQSPRLPPQQTLSLFKQVATGLDYAHSQGVVHGMLSPLNILVSNQFDVRIAGFGLLTLLDLHKRSGQLARPLTHLTSKNGTFLGRPEYIAPERVMGYLIDARSDIYTLGLILFELLSGVLPFSGTQPLEIALQRLQQSAPSIHAVCPDVSEGFDLVLAQMLDRDPAKRIQRAGEAASSLERLIKILDAGQQAAPSHMAHPYDTQVTMPPSVDWFDKAQSPPNVDASFLNSNNPHSLGGIDPFIWGAETSNGFQDGAPLPSAPVQPPLIHVQHAPMQIRDSNTHVRSRVAQLERRKLFTLIGAGMAAAVLIAGGVGITRMIQDAIKQPQGGNNLTAGSTTTGNETPIATTTPETTSAPQATATPKARTTPQPTQIQPTATPQPMPTKPPTHTGTVIGSTSQASNTAVSFTNPADGKASLLVHLASGSWAACEVSCPHAGVAVKYDSGSQKMVCPSHGATFDPANNFAYLSGSGPGNQPALTKVTIRVNSDGTVTTG
jgi:serine/threonine protein kinase